MQKYEIRLEKFNYVELYTSSAHTVSKYSIENKFDGGDKNFLAKNLESVLSIPSTLLFSGNPNYTSQTHHDPVSLVFQPLGNTTFGPRSFGYVTFGWGRGRSNGRNRLICQVCNKAGHTTIQCYHGFNSTYNETSYAMTNMPHNYNHNASYYADIHSKSFHTTP